MTRPEPYTVAAVQAEPVWLDAAATVDRSIELIGEAAAHGARLIAFPELWIPGYPEWIWLGHPFWGMQFVPTYHANSLEVDDEQFGRIAEACRTHAITAVVGASERSGGSIYMAQFVFGADGATIATRRKLKPTSHERAIFGEGDGSDLAVHEVDGIGRLGALNCWEHIQPLSKYAMYAQNEQAHVASWPLLADPAAAHALSAGLATPSSVVYAVEGGCFVVHSTAMLGERGRAVFAQGDPEKTAILGSGAGSAQVFAPDGRAIGSPLPPDKEGLVYADLDLGLIPISKALADPAGHYSRPDATYLVHTRTPRRPVVTVTVPEKLEQVPPAGADMVS